MPDFTVERSASLALGNICTFCSTHAHERGFVNLLIDIVPRGRLYACAGCADQIGRAVGGVDPKQAAEAREREAALFARATTAEQVAQELKDSYEAPMSELIDFFEDRAKQQARKKKATVA